ncbi:MAG: DUF1684 domain-containing protein [Actinomycetia bacterium]|nr:DUF1684 domain-containing protein [Actinomycetes bacterium]
MKRSDLTSHRDERDRFFKEHYATPIPDEDLDTFLGLSYFPANEGAGYVGTYAPSDGSKIQITSTAGTESGYHKRGVLYVSIGDTRYSLTVLDDGDGGLFIPFGDQTNGSETYGGGRYVSVVQGDAETAAIDFDLAENPYCVYDDEFVCPLPPPENRIAIPITAGERMYEGRAQTPDNR